MPPVKSKSDQGFGYGVIAIIVILVIAASQCTSTSKNEQQEAASEFSSNTASAIAALDPVPPEALNQASIKLAAKDYKTVTAAEGLSGAMIYSQNCYEALTHSFSWARVDVCGAFDILAGARLDDASDENPSEAAYFESETLAGRYLAAVTGAGEDAGNADQRLEAVQGFASKISPNPPAATSPGTVNDSAPAWDSDGDEAENVENI